MLAAPAAHAETCDAPGQIPPWRDCDTRPPVAQFTSESADGGARGVFHSTSTANPDRKLVREEWDFDNDGTYDAAGRQTEHLYGPGSYTVKLHVVDDHGDEATATTTWYVRRPDPQAVELTAEKADLFWPNMVQLRGRVAPVEAGIKEVRLRAEPLNRLDYSEASWVVPVAPDGTFSFTRRFPGNTSFTAEAWDPTRSGDPVKSAPVSVYVNWRAEWGWNRIRGNLVEAGFVVRPASASGGLVSRLFYLYWHRPGGKWMRRVAHGRVHLSRTYHAFGYARFHVPRPGRRDVVFFCIRGEGSDGWGRPSSALDRACGLRRLRW